MLTEAELDAWGWRIPFLIGGALAIVVFWLRRGLAETQSFAVAKAEGAPKSGFVELVTRHPRETRSEEHTSELQSLMRISYAVCCLKKTTQSKKLNSIPSY